MTASYTISIAFLFILSQMFTETLSQQCINGGSQKSISGWKLQNHVYKTLKANFGYECVLICRQDSRCQSFNWVISLNMCEFSDRTKEARPEDFVPDPDRYYYTRRHLNFIHHFQEIFTLIYKKNWQLYWSITVNICETFMSSNKITWKWQHFARLGPRNEN